jgi:hypothetical protein
LFGNGNENVFAGSNDAITLGNRNDLVAFGINPSPLPIGNEVVSAFGKGDTLDFNQQLLGNFATAMSDTKQMGADTVMTIHPIASVALRAVAVTSFSGNLVWPTEDVINVGSPTLGTQTSITNALHVTFAGA